MRVAISAVLLSLAIGAGGALAQTQSPGSASDAGSDGGTCGGRSNSRARDARARGGCARSHAGARGSRSNPGARGSRSNAAACRGRSGQGGASGQAHDGACGEAHDGTCGEAHDGTCGQAHDGACQNEGAQQEGNRQILRPSGERPTFAHRAWWNSDTECEKNGGMAK